MDCKSDNQVVMMERCDIYHSLTLRPLRSAKPERIELGGRATLGEMEANLKRLGLHVSETTLTPHYLVSQ